MAATVTDDSSNNPTSVAKSGPGTWMVSGANAYSGGTTVNNGMLMLGNDSALGVGDLAVNSAGTVDLNGHSPSIGKLNGSGLVTDMGNNPSVSKVSTLSVGVGVTSPASSATFSGSIQKLSTQDIAVSKYGAGTQVLAGQHQHVPQAMGGLGLSYKDLITRLIELALERQVEKSKTIYSL